MPKIINPPGMPHDDGWEDGREGVLNPAEYASVLSRLADPVVLIDMEMRIVYQNDAAIQMAGAHAGEKCYTVLDSRDRACDGCPAALSLKDGKTRTVTKKIITRDGKTLFFGIMSNPVRDKSGKVIGFIEVARDMTAARVREEKKRDSLAMLSHDLKSPLTVVQGFAGLIQDRNPHLHPEDVQMLELIKRSAEKATQLLDDFLTLSRIEAGKMRLSASPTSLKLLAEFHTEEFKVLAREKNVRIHTDIPHDLPDALLDESHSSRVLSNLLSNAVKYSKDNGSIWVRAGVVHGGLKRVYLEVTDDGPGIPEKDLPHLFEKYYRGEKTGKQKGAGLGLAIVKALTELQGGAVEADCREGQGTTIRLVLPAVQDALRQEATDC